MKLIFKVMVIVLVIVCFSAIFILSQCRDDFLGGSPSVVYDQSTPTVEVPNMTSVMPITPTATISVTETVIPSPTPTKTPVPLFREFRKIYPTYKRYRRFRCF